MYQCVRKAVHRNFREAHGLALDLHLHSLAGIIMRASLISLLLWALACGPMPGLAVVPAEAANVATAGGLCLLVSSPLELQTSKP